MFTKMKMHDYNEVLGILREIVAQYGADYVYRPATDPSDGTCLYFVDGEPSCIVGHVIHRLGGRVPDDLNWKRFASRVGGPVFENCGLTFSVEAIRLLDRVQSAQDRGIAWGLAVEEAV